MRFITTSILALVSIGVASAAPVSATNGSAVRDLTVSFACNGNQPDLTTWMIQAQSNDNHWVRFTSTADPRLTVYSGVLFLQIPSLQDDRPPRDVELGHVLGPATCDPADDGSGYGNSFVPAYLDVMLDSDVSLSIAPGSPLNTLVVTVDGATYSIQPSSPN